MVGSAILRLLQKEGFTNLIIRTSAELDLRIQSEVDVFFAKEKPDYVFLAAARVGGIEANNRYRADFIYDNLMIEANVIQAAYKNNVSKLLLLGSSCIYPKMAPQPLREEYILSGYLEKTNQPYAIAKIAGIELCNAYRRQYGCNFIAAMPTNLYGPNDNYDPESSHVLPALLKKIIEAKKTNAEYITIWGDGTPKREFMHVDDLASACYFLMQHYDEEDFINIGTGSEIAIIDLAKMIQDIAGYSGEIRIDTSKPNGTPRKLMEISRLTSLGWVASIPLEEGIRRTYSEIKSTI